MFLTTVTWPWPDDLHIQTWPVSSQDVPDVCKWTSYVEAFESYHITDTETYIRHRYYSPHGFTGGPKSRTVEMCIKSKKNSL